MRKNFSGAWATFEYLDDMCAAIGELKSGGFTRITTHSPCPRHEIDHALGNPQSRVPFFTLAGGLLGVGAAVLIITQMAFDWVLPVSGKPILSVPNMALIAFVFAILTAVYFTIGGMSLLILRETLKHPVPRSSRYRDYDRFMRDRFGIVVPCKNDQLETVENILKKHQAEEVNLEN